MNLLERKQKLLDDFKVAQSSREQLYINYNTELDSKATKDDLKLLEATFKPLSDTLQGTINVLESKVALNLQDGLERTRNQLQDRINLTELNVSTISNDIMRELKQFEATHTNSQIKMIEIINRVSESTQKQIDLQKVNNIDNGEL
jgi:hypothetical protein